MKSMIEPKKNPSTDPIDEAQRYLENARAILRECGDYDPELDRYGDPKYVRAAGNYLWQGVLIALDAVFHVQNDRSQRVDIKDYKAAVARRDRKLLSWVVDGYQVMHLSMNYDGAQSKNVCDEGFRLAENIVNKCMTMMPQS